MTEAMIAKEVVNAAQNVARLAESAVKKAWSILDAASEKQSPSKVLSEQAISSIQGSVVKGA
jgi:hypothetical protein